MSKNKMTIMLVVEVLIFIGLYLLSEFVPEVFSGMFSVPFKQVAIGLAALAGLGNIGNGAALMIVVAIALIPIVVSLKMKKESNGKFSRLQILQKVALWATGVAAFVCLWVMMNPAYFSHKNVLQGIIKIPDTADDLNILYGMGALTIWSFVVADLVIALIRQLLTGSTEKLVDYTKNAGYIMMVIIMWILLTEAKAFGNVVQAPTAADKFFIILSIVNGVIAYGFDIVICSMGLKLIDEVKKDEAKGIVAVAGKLSTVCCLSLGITVSFAAIINIMQILFIRSAQNVKVSLNIPVVSMAFTLIILLIARLIVENKKLRDDNDMFI